MSPPECYEALRQARIAENMARLRQKHGLLLNAGVLLGEAPQPVRNPAKRRKVAVPAGPLRKSDRAQNKPAVCYIVDGEPLRPRMKASGKGGKRTSSSVDRWEPSWAVQTEEAILAATNAAHELTDKMNEGRGDDLLAFSKVMMYSHVAKGFWLEAPNGLPAALGARDTMMVDLECSSTTVPVADMVNRDEDGLWEAKLLIRTNGRAFGFSGGWRGVAKDQRLTMNDTVVFEVPPETDGIRVGKPKIKLHIFRGEDYETDETRSRVKPAQVVTADMVPNRKRAKKGAKRASPAGSNAASADGSGEAAPLLQAAPSDEPGSDGSSSDGSDASSGAGSDSEADSDSSDVEDDAPGDAPTIVDVPVRRGGRTSAGKGGDGAAPAAGAGKEGAMPQRQAASARGVASSSQGPSKGPASAAGKGKGSQMPQRRAALGSGVGAGRQGAAPAAGGSEPGGGKQPRSSGAGKENQGAAANNGDGPGKGPGGKVGSAGAGKRKGVARLGEPAGEDRQPKKKAPAPKRKAESVDTAGWYDKAKEGRRDVGAPDLDQAVMEGALPKCSLTALLFNASIEAAEDGTMTFVHPEQPGAYADLLPAVPLVLPKAKVGKGKEAAKGKGAVGAAGSKAATGKAAAKDSAAGTGGAGPSSSRAAGAGAAEAATAAKEAGTCSVHTGAPLPVRARGAAAAGAGSSAASKQAAAKQPVAKRAAGVSSPQRRTSQAAAAKAASAGGSGVTGSPARRSRRVSTAAAEGKGRGKVAAKDKLGVSPATKKKAPAKKAKAKKEPEEFMVEYILGSKVVDGVTKYHIHWLDYPDSDNTWEPIECLDGPPESYDWKVPEAPSLNP